MDVTSLDTEALKTYIANHVRLNRTGEPTYQPAVEELERRQSKGLDCGITRAAILRSASKREFITYGAIAKENGVDWSKAYRPMGQHLDEVMRRAFDAGEPLITAIVVNEKGRKTGALDQGSLDGFIAGAHRLGLKAEGGQAFLRTQQAATFDFAAKLR